MNNKEFTLEQDRFELVMPADSRAIFRVVKNIQIFPIIECRDIKTTNPWYKLLINKCSHVLSLAL